MAILGSLDQIALMIALVLGVFRIDFHSFSKRTKAWYIAGSMYVKISPPTWLFYIVWPIMYILEIAAIFTYVVNQSPTPGQHLDSVVFLFLVQVLLCSWWHPIFFKYKRVGFAGLLITLILVAQMGCLGIMGTDEEWVSFGLMFALFAWCFFAAILNFSWVYVVRSHKEELDQYDSDGEELYESEDNTGTQTCSKRLVKRK